MLIDAGEAKVRLEAAGQNRHVAVGIKSKGALNCATIIGDFAHRTEMVEYIEIIRRRIPLTKPAVLTDYCIAVVALFAALCTAPDKVLYWVPAIAWCAAVFSNLDAAPSSIMHKLGVIALITLKGVRV